MAKFAIECPICGSYAQASTGFFAAKKVQCDCGYAFRVRTHKMASKVCPHCNNIVLVDQSKGENTTCPVCKDKVSTPTERGKMTDFSCGQCGVRISCDKEFSHYTCPVCDHENKVEEQTVKERIKRDGLASVIKYEGDNNTLLWKHPIEDFNLGSQLIVHESQEAVFFKDGQALDTFAAGRYTLETQQLPMLERVYGTLTDNEGTFHSQVYYINLTTQLGIKWGTDTKVRLFDPTSGLHLEIGASGEFNLQITKGRKLLMKVLGTGGKLRQSDFLGNDGGSNYFRGMIITHVKTYLAETIKELAINILEIDAQLLRLSQGLQEKINHSLAPYGLELPEFFISRILTPDDDKNFIRMKQQYAQRYLNVRDEEIRRDEAIAAAERKTVEAQTAARLKLISAQGDAEAMKIGKFAEAETYKVQAEAEAMEMQMKGYTYQDETSRQVGLEAMQNGIPGGSSESGGSLLGDMASLGVSMAAMGSVMGITQQAITPALAGMGAATPPPQGIPMVNPTAVQQSPQENVTAPSAVVFWTCECGEKENRGKFCQECGLKKPEPPKDDFWTCECGESENKGRCCINCGKRKPVELWECSCGEKENRRRFCSNCGKKKDS